MPTSLMFFLFSKMHVHSNSGIQQNSARPAGTRQTFFRLGADERLIFPRHRATGERDLGNLSSERDITLRDGGRSVAARSIEV